MSSASAADRRTYWCHECDMSVTLASTSSSSLLCPHCLTDFLEHMDFTTPTSSSSPPDSDPSSFVIVDPLPATSDDNYLLNSPQFLRLFQHLADSSDSNFTPFAPIKPSVVPIPTIKVSSSMLDKDPVLICAICKDQFLVEVEAKQLPCSHLYHPDCILPWLSNHDSCPLCRFTLPSDYPSDHVRYSAATMNLSRARDLIDDARYEFRTTIQNIARWHSSILSEIIQMNSSSQSPTQLGVVEMGNGQQTHSGETVSSVDTDDDGIVIVNSSGDINGLVGMDGSIGVSHSSFVSANLR